MTIKLDHVITHVIACIGGKHKTIKQVDMLLLFAMAVLVNATSNDVAAALTTEYLWSSSAAILIR